MGIHRYVKDSFSVIGKKGSTNDGKCFIQRLWEDADSLFEEIEHLAKRDETEMLVGYGEPCPIYPVPMNRGRKILQKDFILRELRKKRRQSLRLAG